MFTLAAREKDVMTEAELKSELLQYLEKRKQAGADEGPKELVMVKQKVVPEFALNAPREQLVAQSGPNVFDYSELTKYGYSHLVTAIMNFGGRRAIYELMGMEPPTVNSSVSPAMQQRQEDAARGLVIDRTGASDQARYSGLKVTQAMDDSVMAEALEEANRKAKSGERMRPMLEEENYVQPFADKRNVSPRQTPDWTPEKIDEEGRMRGKATSWARRVKSESIKTDPFETVNIEGGLRAYSILTFAIVSFAFGKSTASFFHMLDMDELGSSVTTTLQYPALAMIAAAIGSAVVSSNIASEKNRSKYVWALKGLFGGPVAIAQVRNLDPLMTAAEKEQQDYEL